MENDRRRRICVTFLPDYLLTFYFIVKSCIRSTDFERALNAINAWNFAVKIPVATPYFRNIQTFNMTFNNEVSGLSSYYQYYHIDNRWV